MSHEWGRAPEAGRWQRAIPIWFMSLLVLALASGVGLWLFRQTFVWTPLQRFYLSACMRSAVASSLGIRTGRYRLLMMDTSRGSRLAIDDEVAPITLPTGKGTFELSELAHQAQSGRLVWLDLVYDHARLHAQLRAWIYADQALTDLARPSLMALFVVVIAGLLIALPNDAKWARSRRHGRRLKGFVIGIRSSRASSLGCDATAPAAYGHPDWSGARIQRRDRLGGVIHEYGLAARHNVCILHAGARNRTAFGRMR